jgi:alpha-galactosidase
MRLPLFLSTSFALAAMCPLHAAVPTPAEAQAAKRWAHDTLLTEKSTKPFSFFYGGQRSAAVLGAWQRACRTRALDDQRVEHTLTWTDPATGLCVRCVAIEYRDLPAVEWTLWFKNTGTADTPILENICPLDTSVGTPQQSGPFTLHYADGSHENGSDFQPRTARLISAGETVMLRSYGGRSSDGCLPFFNLVRPDGGGLVVGIGWTGQWTATLRRAKAPQNAPPGPGNVEVRAGMEATHLRLHAGEEIRSPAILYLPWSGRDWLRGQNLLRAVLLRHYSPRVQGRPAVPPVAFSPHGAIRFESVSEANMLAGIEQVAAARLPLDTWWMDAGWYARVDPRDTLTGNQNWASCVGNPDPDPARFPRGMKPIADAAHRHGMKFLLWFEPERVMPGTWLYKNHRPWLIAPPPSLPVEQAYMRRAGFHLFDLGNDAARQWLTDHISRMIGQCGIDFYRQDCNLFPLDYWRWGEPADRLGMREIRHVMGLYRFWDDLLRRHPQLVIDNCASGGRRLDFEMLRRSFVLWRSDMGRRSLEAMQAQQFALSLWLPITGVSGGNDDRYAFRSGMGGTFIVSAPYLAQPTLLEAVRPLLEQYLSVRRLYQGDFYPLTPYALDRDTWIAWQFHRPDLGEGLVQAFRRPESGPEAITVSLRDLDPQTRYEIENLDGGKQSRLGRDLAAGLTITLKTRPAAALYRIRVLKP